MDKLPAGVLAFADRGADWAAHVARLPRLVRELTAEWGLVEDGLATHGYASLVVPVRPAGSAAGEPAVLKVAFPDLESEHEALALQRWGGAGAVRLLRADPRRRAMVLERLHPTDLSELWDLEACEVVAGLYARLHVPAPPQLRTLATYLAPHLERLAALPRDAPVPRRMVEQALSAARALLADSPAVVVHGDLHYGNVLAADREPWLAIDPKPMSGDPHYELAPMLWNRWDEVVASGDVRDAVHRRFLALVDAALLDEERARDWVVVRMVVNALWELEQPRPDRDTLTTCIAVAKAAEG